MKRKKSNAKTQRRKGAKHFFSINGFHSLRILASLRHLCQLCAFALILSLFTACTPTETTVETIPNTPNAAALAAMPKQLATVEISPTPGDAERAATRAAIRLTNPAPPTATPPATPTVYIGVFLGAVAGNANDDAPIVDIARYEGTLQSEPAALPTPECLIPVDVTFGENWRLNLALPPALGCPTEPPAAYVGTTQLFERGVMYFIPTGEIYTIAIEQTGGRFWYVPQAPADQGWVVAAPEGLRMPQFGFGAVWKAIEGVREALGFARLDETPISITIQRFDRGALIRDVSSAQVFALVGQGGGEAYGPF